MVSAMSGKQVTYTRRFFGDFLLEGLLAVLTLGIGWLIWFAIVAPKGQTPAKQLLSVYIHDFDTGQRASAGKVWLREIVWKIVAPFVISIVGAVVLNLDFEDGENLGNLFYLAGALFVFS